MATTPSTEYINSLILTREQMIERILDRFDEGELMYVPFTYTPAILTENYEPDENIDPFTKAEFRRFVEWHTNDDEFFDYAYHTDNHIMDGIIGERGKN